MFGEHFWPSEEWLGTTALLHETNIYCRENLTPQKHKPEEICSSNQLAY